MHETILIFADLKKLHSRTFTGYIDSNSLNQVKSRWWTCSYAPIAFQVSYHSHAPTARCNEPWLHWNKTATTEKPKKEQPEECVRPGGAMNWNACGSQSFHLRIEDRIYGRNRATVQLTRSSAYWHESTETKRAHQRATTWHRISTHFPAAFQASDFSGINAHPSQLRRLKPVLPLNIRNSRRNSYRFDWSWEVPSNGVRLSSRRRDTPSASGMKDQIGVREGETRSARGFWVKNSFTFDHVFLFAASTADPL